MILDFETMILETPGGLRGLEGIEIRLLLCDHCGGWLHAPNGKAACPYYQRMSNGLTRIVCSRHIRVGVN